MKKTLLSLISLVLIGGFSSAFASIQVGAIPQQPYDGSNYVGKIVAAEYDTSSGQPRILLMTLKDEKNKENKIPDLTIVVDGADLPFGMALASAIDKKVAIFFGSPNYDISYINLVTDEYYYGSKHPRLH